MDPVIIGSARKHNVHDDDIIHAFRHPTRVLQLDDLVMLIGPAGLDNSSRSASAAPTESTS